MTALQEYQKNDDIHVHSFRHSTGIGQTDGLTDRQKLLKQYRDLYAKC